MVLTLTSVRPEAAPSLDEVIEIFEIRLLCLLRKPQRAIYFHSIHKRLEIGTSFLETLFSPPEGQRDRKLVSFRSILENRG